jgi:DNA-binding transcriptional ArsR family regulator
LRGKKNHHLLIGAISIVTIMLFSCNMLGVVAARVVQVPGYMITDRLHANEGAVIYNFTGNNQYTFSTNAEIQLTLSIGIPLRFRHVKVTIDSSTNLGAFAQNLEFSNIGWVNWFEADPDNDGNLTAYNQTWGSYLFFGFNNTGFNIDLGVNVEEDCNISSSDKWVYYGNGTWHLLDTVVIDGWLHASTTIMEPLMFFSVFASNESSSNPIDPPIDPPTDPPGDDDESAAIKQAQQRATVLVSIGISIAIIVVVVVSISFTGKEYRDQIRAKATQDVESRHKLTIDEVLENENRVLIIDTVLANPGIHFNELMRKTSLAPGNLVWHLEILCKYKVIGKKAVGQYMVYFPFSSANPLKDMDISLVKSKVTLQILNIVEDEPGIYANIIAKRLGLDHKTVKYHVDKLLLANLVIAEKEGRTRKLSPRLPISKDTGITSP